MDDRKRPGLEDVDNPPTKRQAIAVNGIKAHPDADMPWKDDIERYQKDAILRQMKEYKSQCKTLQTDVDELKKRSVFLEDQLPVVYGWLSQILDELSLWTQTLPKADGPRAATFESSLALLHDVRFADHLRPWSEKLRKVSLEIFSRCPTGSPEVAELQQKLSKLIAKEKVWEVERNSISLEKTQLSDSLEKATVRYMSAEKKLERARSAQVAKIEAQAIQASRPEPTSATTEDGFHSKMEVVVNNGVVDDGAAGAAVDAARKEAVAVAEKRAEQLLKLETDNKKLSEDLTSMKAKFSTLTDDDYATSELFLAMKCRYEETIKRVNDLEARNIQLREEAQSLQAERLAYREQNDKELEHSTIELQSQLARNDADLARIRTHRDDLMAQLSVKESVEAETSLARQQMQQLADAQQSRITALEAENERLTLRLGTEKDSLTVPEDNFDGLNMDALRTKLISIEKEYALLSNELPSMAEAYKKASAIAYKKVTDLTEWEDKIGRLTAEKAKADQKYFGAMRAKETRESEIRALRSQNAKSSEIVSQLKEAESSCRQLLVALEKQLSEAKDNIVNLTSQQHTLKQGLNEEKLNLDRSASSIADLKKQVMNKDAANHVATHSQRQLEVELVEVRTRLDQSQVELESWKKRASGTSSDESEMLRALVLCSVCRKNFKNTCLKTCGHLFCEDCVEQRMQNRARKCPNCGKAFGHKDYMKVTL